MVLYHLALAMVERFGLDVPLTPDLLALTAAFPEVLKRAAAFGRVVLVVDDLRRAGAQGAPPDNLGARSQTLSTSPLNATATPGKRSWHLHLHACPHLSSGYTF